MEYKGDNGTITVDGEHLTITHSGLEAKVGGLAPGQPWRIPLQAVSGVKLKEAGRWSNSGWLSLGIGGIEPPEEKLTEIKAEIITFRHKANRHFVALHEWLLTVIEHNRAEGIEPSTVEFEPAPGLVEKQRKAEQAKAEQDGAEQERSVKKQEKMVELLGEDRPDIVAAAARMGFLNMARRELKNLASQLYEGETVRCLAEGTYQGADGILVVLTDVRLLIVNQGLIGHGMDDFPLRLITGVQTSSGLLNADLRLSIVGRETVTITNIYKDDVPPLAAAIREGMARQHSAADQRAPAAPVAGPPVPAEDPYEAMRKLATLRDEGVLSEKDYEAKKQEILDRI